MHEFEYYAFEITENNFAEVAEQLDGYTAEDIQMEAAHFLQAGHRTFLICDVQPEATHMLAIITESYFDAIWNADEPKSTPGYFKISHK